MIYQKILRSVWTHYGAMSLPVMLPLLMPGYILTLDLVFTPHISWPTELSNTWVFQALLHIVNVVVPSEVIEKLLLLTVLVLSGVGAHKLVKHLAVHGNKNFLVWGAYFAGIFYMLNPFIYSRFMAGQYLVLLGYAMTPFFVVALMRLIKTPSWRTAAITAAWAAVIIAVSLHHVGVLLLVVVAFGLAALWRYRQQVAHIKKVVMLSAAVVASLLLIHSYWLVPTLLGGTNISQATASFDQVQYNAFATNDQGGLGAIGNVLRLQGFWADAQQMYVLPQQQVPAWGLVVAMLWIVVGIGAIRMWRKNRNLAIMFITIALLAILVAATPIIAYFAGIVPFISGYREPQKFVALLVLVYAVFASAGVAGLVQRVYNSKLRAAASASAAALLVLPVACMPTMLWGFNGQLTPRDYPADWYAMNDQLNTLQATKMLFLPWHEYMNFGFSGRVIANPAAKFFDTQTVVGDNPEYKNINPTVPNMTNRRIEQEVLMGGDHTTRLGERLTSFGFSHVLLAKEYDYKDYAYLDKQADLRLVRDTDNLRLYEVVKSGRTNE